MFSGGGVLSLVGSNSGSGSGSSTSTGGSIAGSGDGSGADMIGTSSDRVVVLAVSAFGGPDADEPLGASISIAEVPAAADERGRARVPEATGEHHEHEDTSDHHHRTTGSRWRRLLWSGALVLICDVHRTQTRVMNSG